MADPVKPKSLTVEKTERETLTEQITAIEQEFGGVGNIPVNHNYWELVNQLRGLKK